MLYTSNFVIKEMKGRTIISNEQNFPKQSFLDGFMHLKIKIKEKFKLKTKLSKTKISSKQCLGCLVVEEIYVAGHL